jgi:hypothetical protein
MGLDKKAVAKIVCRSPEIFASDVDNTLRKKIDFLIDFGVSERQLPRIIRKYPELLLLDINHTLLPRYVHTKKILLQMLSQMQWISVYFLHTSKCV